jgi:parallel beta-helix repeat protein
LGSASPGEVLQLADGTYSGNFVANTSGTEAKPIVLRGGRGAVLNGGSTSQPGYTLHLLDANNWRLEGFSVQGGQKGIMLHGSSNNVLTGLDVSKMGMEAVHFRGMSSDNVIENSEIHNTGLDTPGFGEGVYLGTAKSNWSKLTGGKEDHSDRNQVLNNRIYDTPGESIDIKEGTTGGLISGNFFEGSAMKADHFSDSWIDVKGNGYRIVGNTGANAFANGFETHVQLPGWGQDNVFTGNTLEVNSAGFGIKVDEPDASGNIVGCDNTATGAGSGLANLPCS